MINYIKNTYNNIIVSIDSTDIECEKGRGKGDAVEMDRKNAANLQTTWRHKIYGYLLFHCYPMLTNFNGSEDTRLHGNKVFRVLPPLDFMLEFECRGLFIRTKRIKIQC